MFLLKYLRSFIFLLMTHTWLYIGFSILSPFFKFFNCSYMRSKLFSRGSSAVKPETFLPARSFKWKSSRQITVTKSEAKVFVSQPPFKKPPPSGPTIQFFLSVTLEKYFSSKSASTSIVQFKKWTNVNIFSSHPFYCHQVRKLDVSWT